VEVWTDLINNNKVPYLATLRNLRNILQSGVAFPLIDKVAAFLENPAQVEKARTTPLQYYSALEELAILLKPKDKEGMKKAVELYHGKKK
jgi:60 kDa SS-A/Ro ribonucleoprotein